MGGLKPLPKKVLPKAAEEAVLESELVEEMSPDAGFIVGGDGEEIRGSEYTFSWEKRSPKSRWQWGAGAAVFGILVLAVLLSTVFARITIKVKPNVENVEVKDIIAALDVSVSRPLFPQKVVPAELLEFSRKKQGEFESTGREYIEDKARGKVKIFNSFSSSAQTLVEGTRFVTDSGALYRLIKTIAIPGAKIDEGKIIPEFIEAELVADKAGEEENVSREVGLKIPGFKGTAKYEGFYAKAPSGFSGGFKGDARVVSKDDLKKAEEQVSKEVFEELRQEILRKVPSDFKLLDALREIQITKLDAPRPGTRRDKFSVEAEARGRILIFRENDTLSLVKELVLNGDQTKEVVNNSARLGYEVRSVDFNKKKSEIVIRGGLNVKSVVPVEEIRGLIRGRKEGSILEVLKGRSELATFSVAFFPPWIFSAPDDPDKIRLVIQGP